MTFGSLFAGIGGMDLGLERAGMTCKWQVEIDPFARRVLAKHWPDVRRHDDVRTFPPTDPEEWKVDLICGGFPCQDISDAGKKIGISGSRSGLWSEYARIIGSLRPRHVLVENVSALLRRGIGRVLGDLSMLGYDSEWATIPAAALGLPQPRWRTFIIAYADGLGCQRVKERHREGAFPETWDWDDGLGMAEHRAGNARSWVRRANDGIPNRVDRTRCLGNAVAPDVAEWIGRRIMEAR